MLRAFCAIGIVALASVSAGAYQDPYRNNQDPYRSRPMDSPRPDESTRKGPQAAEGEVQAAKKVQAASDGAAALQSGGEFIKKYPKSTLRLQVAQLVAGKISQTADNSQKISLAENFPTVFNQPGEADVITPTLVDAYSKANKFDEAFQKVSPWLEKNPEDVRTLVQMALTGADQAKHGNRKFADVSQKYGLKAIELIEADKRPASLDAEQWAEYKTKWLSQVYQSEGFLSMLGGNADDAKARLQKAISLSGSDPFNYVMLGMVYDNAYQQHAEQHKKMSPGPAEEALLKTALATMDQVIEAYLHAIALAEGDGYKALHDSLLESVQTYYKYRHNGSTTGLQQAIDKYKKPAGQ